MDWSGCTLGLIGAFLLAANTRFSRWGWVAFLLSNVAWLGYAVHTSAWALLLQQAGFTITSLIGLHRWFGTRPLPTKAPL